MRIAIVEDEKKCYQELNCMIEKWKGEAEKADIAVDYYPSAEALLFTEDYYFYDLYFLDILLGRKNGYELGEEIRNKNESAVIVFVTNDMGYLEKGYHLAIFRYIRKPLVYARICECLEYGYEQSALKGKTLKFRSRTNNLILLQKNIMYIAAGTHVVNVYMSDRTQYKMPIRCSFAEFHERLHNQYMIRVHKSFIVNMMYVTRFDKRMIFLHGEKYGIQVGRTYGEDVFQRLCNYFYADTDYNVGKE